MGECMWKCGIESTKGFIIRCTRGKAIFECNEFSDLLKSERWVRQRMYIRKEKVKRKWSGSIIIRRTDTFKDPFKDFKANFPTTLSSKDYDTSCTTGCSLSRDANNELTKCETGLNDGFIRRKCRQVQTLMQQ